MTEAMHHILILGGGIAGMSAATLLDDQGVHVHLVEKMDHLGGKVFDWACMATDTCQYCGACISPELADQVGRLHHTKIYLESRLSNVKRNRFGFWVTIEGKEQIEINVQAILVATGLSLFDPSELEFFEYNHDRVITTAELNGILKQEHLSGLLSNNPSPSIAFIQCVGSRNRALGLDYCSQVCCKTSVRQANKILHLLPEAAITFFHIDLQIIGKIFRTQYALIREHVRFIQGTPAKILLRPEKDLLTVIGEDEQSGARVAFDFDLIVLAIGTRRHSDTPKIADTLGARTDQWGFLGNRAGRLPEGIYAAGSISGPTDILTARQQGIFAARQILQDLYTRQEPDQRHDLAVIGAGNEGQKIAQALVDKGHSVFLFDRERHDIPDQEGITYFPKSRLIEVSGTCGRFQILADTEGKEQEVNAFALILANGVDREPLNKDAGLSSFGDAMISLSQFSNRFHHAADDFPENVIFWLDRAGPEWKIHARQSLLMAAELCRAGKTVTVMMEKMLVHGLEGQRIYDQARKLGARFFRVSSPSRVTLKKHDDASLTLELTEATLPGVKVTVPCDLLVLPEKIQASPENPIFAQSLRQVRDEEGFLQSANTRHRPVGSPRRGIFFAGSCHDEIDDQGLEMDIQAVLTSLDLLASWDGERDIPPSINEGRCVKCFTCYNICPHAAITLKNNTQPFIVSEACFGCGLCVSSCPTRAVIGEKPPDDPMPTHRVPKTVVFVCERSAGLAVKSVKQTERGDNKDISIVPIPCAGQLDAGTLINPFLRGAGRVMVVACHNGNCRSMKGGKVASSRIERICTEMSLSSLMLSYHALAANETGKMRHLIRSAAGGE